MFLKSWLNKMKGKCLPPSARKVMRMENTLLCRLEELSGKLEYLNTRLNELSGQHGYLDGRIQALKEIFLKSSSPKKVLFGAHSSLC